MYRALSFVIQNLLKIARDSHCTDVRACEEILKGAADDQRSLIRALLDARVVDEAKFLRAVGNWLGIPWWEEAINSVAAPLREKIPARVALRHQVGPLKLEDGLIWIGLYDPFDLMARQAFAGAVAEKLPYNILTRTQILQALRQGYGVGAETFDAILEGRSSDSDDPDLSQEPNGLDLDDSEASVVKFVNQILREALEQRATDVHCE